MIARKEITGRFSRIRWSNDQNDFVIGEIIVDEDDLPSRIGFKGNASRESFDKDGEYLFFGRVVDEGSYGPTLVFSSFTDAIPTSSKSFISYIAKHGAGCRVGPATAKKIFEVYGEKSIDRIIDNPKLLVDEFKVPEDKAILLADRLQENVNFQKTLIQLMSIFDGRGFPKDLPSQLMQIYGVKAVEIVTTQTYELLNFSGVGFKTCDKLYIDTGGDPESIERQMYCGYYYGILEDRTGSTWCPAINFARAIERHATLEPKLKEAVALGCERELIAYQKVDGKRYMADFQEARYEAEICRLINESFEEEVYWPDPTGPMFDAMTDHQKDELQVAFGHTRPLAGFAGSAGSGKTFTTAPIIRWACSEFGEDSVFIMTPTGKAAVRSREVMLSNGIYAEPTTVHSALMWRGGSSFAINERQKLERAKLIVIDEVSMFDNMLLWAVLSARPEGCRVLLVGDPRNQLPPVGRGCPALDLLNSEIVPFGCLTEIHRNAGMIVKACHSITQGNLYETADKIDVNTNANLRHFKVKDEDMATKICDLVEQGKRAFDPIWDMQVICPLNKSSSVAREKLNRMLQKRLNPSGRSVRNNPFRVGDKVICRKNSRLNDLRGRQVFVANGDMGVVTDIKGKLVQVEFKNPDRKVNIPRGSGEDYNCDIQLGYAITCHSSQGSSFKCVMVALDGSRAAEMICDRSWLYTAISRSETICLTIGRMQIARRMIKRVGVHKRKTFLTETLRGEFSWYPFSLKTGPKASKTQNSPSLPTIENQEPAGTSNLSTAEAIA